MREPLNDRQSSKVVALIKTIGNERANLDTLPDLIFIVCKSRAWETGYYSELLHRVVPPMTFEKFVSEPVPIGGLGTTVDRLKTYCRDDIKALDAITEATQKKPTGRPPKEDREIVDNVNDLSERPTGNSRERALRKLRKDAPELHKRVLSNELSCHAAMIEAGFRKKRTPLDDLNAAWRRASDSERAGFLEHIKKPHQTNPAG